MKKRPLRKKSNARKIKLIKKYAKIRFNRFWSEWGISKEELGMFVGALSIFVGLFAFYIVGCMF